MIGRTIKGFKITRWLGKGGTGEVWMAEHPIVNTRVAIKFLLPELATDEQVVTRFFQEAEAAGRIKHAGIVKFYDAGFDGDNAFLIMELLEGETLRSRMRRVGRFPPSEAVELCRQIASVLAATHAAGITHRDLKPENVFLVQDAELASGERVMLLDFGIAKLGGTTGLTANGGLLGTPAYMAPEQWAHPAKVDPRVDVYALGCIAFELCCGRPPFEMSSVFEACARHANEIPPRVRTLAAEVPVELDAAIAAMLAKQPGERRTMAEVQRALAAIGASERIVLASTHPAGGDAGTSHPPARTSLPEIVLPDAAEPAHDTTLQSAATASVSKPPPRRWRRFAAAGAIAALGVAGAVMVRRALGAVEAPVDCPSDMVRVPAGTFEMGNPDGTGSDDEHPRHRVTLSAYCVDRTEVTVAAYARCVAGGACTATRDTNEGLCNAARGDRAEHPINCVDWAQAAAYCRSMNRRLPSEAEWEYAARGGDGRSYPWGDEPPDARRLNACGDECRKLGERLHKRWSVMYGDSDDWETTAPTSSLPHGASPFGALHMADNVSEWTADWYARYPAGEVRDPHGARSGDARVIRGGDWSDDAAAQVRTARRARLRPDTVETTLGFRCALGS